MQPRLGAVFRREKVTRFYLNEFTNEGYLKGFRKWLILNRASKVSEDEFARMMSGGCKTACRSTVIVFEGLRNYFRDLWHHHEVVREELYKIAAPQILQKVALIREPYIAMHVRRGDVNIPVLMDKHYTPLDWFVAAAQTIRREAAWRDLPIYVVSDGHEHELTGLLAVPNCRLMTLGTAIGDMLLLAKARLLFASAHSTFSMWGSYLGRVPALYYPGKMDENVFPPGSVIFESEWSVGQELPRPVEN
jgi:hypothetical protein